MPGTLKSLIILLKKKLTKFILLKKIFTYFPPSPFFHEIHHHFNNILIPERQVNNCSFCLIWLIFIRIYINKIKRVLIQEITNLYYSQFFVCITTKRFLKEWRKKKIQEMVLIGLFERIIFFINIFYATKYFETTSVF